MSQAFRTFLFRVGLLFLAARLATALLTGIGIQPSVSTLGGIATAGVVAWWRSKRIRNAHRREALQAAENAAALANDAKIRVASPWMTDLDDYGPPSRRS